MRLFSTATHLLVALILLVLSTSAGFSQTASQRLPANPPQRPIDGSRNPADESPLTTLEEEMRAKREIKIAEKEHQENLNRAKEIADIGKQLKDSLKDKSLDRDCLKKIDRLEKLTKKVRGEAGGEDQDVSIPNQAKDLPSAVTQIADAAETLSKDVEKTPRQVVSASVICNANVLLELIKVARTFA